MDSSLAASLPAGPLVRILEFVAVRGALRFSDHCSVASLCSATCVSRSWRDAATHPSLWRRLRFSSGCEPSSGYLYHVSKKRRQLNNSCLESLVRRSHGTLHTLDFTSCLWPNLTVAGVVKALRGYEGKLAFLGVEGLLVTRRPDDLHPIESVFTIITAVERLRRFLAPVGFLDIMLTVGGGSTTRLPQLCCGTGDEGSSGSCGRLCGSFMPVCEDCGICCCGSCQALLHRGDHLTCGVEPCEHTFCRKCFFDRAPLTVSTSSMTGVASSVVNAAATSTAAAATGAAGDHLAPRVVDELLDMWNSGGARPWEPGSCDNCDEFHCAVCAVVTEGCCLTMVCDDGCGRYFCPKCSDEVVICSNVDKAYCTSCIDDAWPPVMYYCDSCFEPLCADCFNGISPKCGVVVGSTMMRAGGTRATASSTHQRQRGGDTCCECGENFCLSCASGEGRPSARSASSTLRSCDFCAEQFCAGCLRWSATPPLAEEAEDAWDEEGYPPPPWCTLRHGQPAEQPSVLLRECSGCRTTACATCCKLKLLTGGGQRPSCATTSSTTASSSTLPGGDLGSSSSSSSAARCGRGGSSSLCNCGNWRTAVVPSSGLGGQSNEGAAAAAAAAAVDGCGGLLGGGDEDASAAD